MKGRTSTHKDFLSRLEKQGDCLVWTGAKVFGGYGQFKIKQVWWRTHRYSYTYYVGDIPEGLLVLHSCDNPPCVLPSHLRVGTQADNMAEMTVKGRASNGDGGWGRTRFKNDKECGKGHLREEHTNTSGKCRECFRIAKKKRVARNRT